MSFEHYQQQMEERIRRSRRDLEEKNAEWIITANSPFQFLPKNPKPDKGIVLIHGLLDSPFKMQDLGRFFQTQGFLVHGILLEGHGTNPENLENVTYQEWIEHTKSSRQFTKNCAKCLSRWFFNRRFVSFASLFNRYFS